MPPTIRRQIFLDHGRVQIDLPRLMTDDQLAHRIKLGRTGKMSLD
jgi:hypothetical protein